MESSSFCLSGDLRSSASDGPPPSGEASGWTAYFVDFVLSTEEKRELAPAEATSSSAVSDGSSRVSDAASTNDDGTVDVSAWKNITVLAAAVQAAAEKQNAPPVRRGNHKKKSFSSRKKRVLPHLRVEDDALEDTATSPLNSP